MTATPTTPEGWDDFIGEAVPKEYLPLAPYMRGATVLDIGAHVGHFTEFALRCGAVRVIAVEPWSRNISRFLERHHEGMHDGRVVLFPCMVGGIERDNDHQVATFYPPDLSRMANTGLGSRCVDDGNYMGLASIVPVISLSALMYSYEPRAMKMDIEGGEWFMRYPLLDCLDAVSIELHRRKIHRHFDCDEAVLSLWRKFERAGLFHAGGPDVRALDRWAAEVVTFLRSTDASAR